MENCLLSVIIPVYNGEKYLRRAVYSVESQPLSHNIEIVIVNDGSKDKSGEIADSIAKENSNVSVYHQENQGVAAARNFAIKNSKGKYVAFLDCDDWWEPNFFDEDIANEFLENDIDIYHFSYRRIVANKRYCEDTRIKPAEYHFDKNGQQRYEWQHLCSHIIKKDLLLQNTIEFPYVKICEDRVFMEKVHYLCRSIKKIDKIIFCYWCNAASCIHANKSEILLEHSCKAYEHLDSWLKEYGEKFDVDSMVLLWVSVYLPGICSVNTKKDVDLLLHKAPYRMIYEKEKLQNASDLAKRDLNMWLSDSEKMYGIYRKKYKMSVIAEKMGFVSGILKEIVYVLRKTQRYHFPYKNINK